MSGGMVRQTTCVTSVQILTHGNLNIRLPIYCTFFKAVVSAIQAAMVTIGNVHVDSDIPVNCRTYEFARLDTTIRLLDEFATVGVPLGTLSHNIDTAVLHSMLD